MPGEQTQEPVTRGTDYHFVQVLYAGEAFFFAILANKPAHAKDNFVTPVTFFLKLTVLRYNSPVIPFTTLIYSLCNLKLLPVKVDNSNRRKVNKVAQIPP